MHYEEALAKKDRIISRRDATIAKAARDATAQLAVKDAEIVRLQARVQQFEDAAAAMSRLSSSTEKRSRADVADAAAAAAAAVAAAASGSSLSGARSSLSLQKSKSAVYCQYYTLTQSDTTATAATYWTHATRAIIPKGMFGLTCCAIATPAPYSQYGLVARVCSLHSSLQVVLLQQQQHHRDTRSAR
jgi:hypothetical protein